MKPILYFLLFSIVLASAQDQWLEKDLTSFTENYIIKDAVPFVNEDNNQLALFFKNRKKIFGYLYNEKQELISTISPIEIPKKAQILIGKTYNNDSYTLYFSNTRKTYFSSISINFITKNFNVNDNLGIHVKGEKVIDFLIDKHKIYILSIVKKTSILKTYELDNNGLVGTKEFDFSNEVIKSDKGWNYNLYHLLYGNPTYSTVELIKNDIPNALEKTSAYTKLYFKKGKLTLTNNLFDRYTYLITIDLDKSTQSFEVINNKDFVKQNLGDNSSSYIFKNYFFNIYSNNKKLNFNIHDLKTKKLIKSFEILKDSNITFKNSPIIQEGGELNKYREFEKTSKFLRKITNSKIGITAYQEGDDIIITLGASEVVQSNNIAIGVILGGAIGGAIFSSFNSYANTKSTRINCLFDKEFNHKKGEVPLNSFDKINNFIEDNKLKKHKLQTIFKYKDNYIWGALDKETYRLYKFN